MVFTTIIPTYRNDGSPVDQAEMNEILKEIWERFGGATIDGQVEGHWIDDQGRHYQDTGVRVTVATDRTRLLDAQATVREIGRKLEQKAMYFEVRYYDGAQILEIE